MWKKDEAPAQRPSAQPEASPQPERTVPASASRERATIGRSIAIRGDVTGDEDLMIQGRVDGSVDLQQHSVTIGPEGEVKASVVGRVVTVEGQVEGNIVAEEQIILRSSALVHGDITAPRVVLEDGARFRGGVDMGESADRGRRTGGATGAESRKIPQGGSPTPSYGKPASPVETASAEGKSPSDTAAEAKT